MGSRSFHAPTTIDKYYAELEIKVTKMDNNKKIEFRGLQLGKKLLLP